MLTTQTGPTVYHYPKEIKSILKLSNYGKLGGYVWKVISNARWSTVDSKGAYLISSLRKERNNQ